MELEGKDFNPDVDEIPGETSFIEPASSFTEPRIHEQNDAISMANNWLAQAELPSIDEIILKKGKGRVVDKRLFSAIVEVVKPRDVDGINAAINIYDEYSRRGGTYDDFVSKRFLTREEIDSYLTSSIDSVPNPPINTPGVDTHTQNTIGVKLSKLDIYSGIDHSKFVLMDDGGLAVKTSKGSQMLTYVRNPELFVKNPKIPTVEYQGLFGLNKDEYTKRVEKANARTIAPVDEEVDADQGNLTDFKSWLSKQGDTVKDRAKNFIDRLKSNRKTSEFNYREELEMSDIEGRLPERELVAIDQRFQTIEGQISVAVSKAANLTEQIQQLDAKEDKSPNELAKLQQLKDELDAQNGLISDLKGDLSDNTAKMQKQRNLILDIGGGLAAGRILMAIFEVIANALGSNAVKGLIPKSTDPKDIIESGIGKIIRKNLEDLAAYFNDRYLNTSGAVQAFWHMMENAVDGLESNLWIIIAAALTLLAYEINKHR